MTISISNTSTRDTGIAALINANNNKSPTNEATNFDESNYLFGEDGFTFSDIIDIVNPLQHIPIIGAIYRKISGDTIAPGMEVAGGALYGGPLGAAISFVTSAIEFNINKDNVDSGSPALDNQSTTIDPTTVASNTSPVFPKTIDANDYSQKNDLVINQTALNTPKLDSDNYRDRPRHDTWVLSSNNITRAGNTPTNINTLQNKHAYQTGDGIINPAHNAIKSYTNVITSNKVLEKNIDITIGSSTETTKPAFSI